MRGSLGKDIALLVPAAHPPLWRHAYSAFREDVYNARVHFFGNGREMHDSRISPCFGHVLCTYGPCYVVDGLSSSAIRIIDVFKCGCVFGRQTDDLYAIGERLAQIIVCRRTGEDGCPVAHHMRNAAGESDGTARLRPIRRKVRADVSNEQVVNHRCTLQNC